MHTRTEGYIRVRTFTAAHCHTRKRKMETTNIPMNRGVLEYVSVNSSCEAYVAIKYYDGD